MIKESLKNTAASLPDSPGVYMFYDRDNKLIYVGKARCLRKRVMSYFGKNQVGKTKVMVSRIKDIRHTVVASESEALLLENNLIKKHQPRYNVLLKDDKTFPWICVKNEAFPRVFMTRSFVRDGSVYFGPYTSVVMVRTLLGLIKQLYPLRTCSYNLTPEKISENKYKVCLEYHIGNCLAPCIGKQDEQAYNKAIKQIKDILKGNVHTVRKYLKELMARYSEETKFEEAQIIKEKLAILDRYQSRSVVVNPRIRDVDVFGLEYDNDKVYINYLKIIRGAVVQTHTIELRKRIEETNKEILSLAITELRTRHESSSPEVIVAEIPDLSIEGLKYTIPRKGDKLRLLELAERNSRVYMLNQRKRDDLRKPQERHKKNLELMKKDLHLPVLPAHIECFDNSNIQGASPVAACVVFRNTKPSKKEYRHYNIKTVEGPDDFASMEEVVFRRYRRLMDEDASLPDLVVIDGGKGQLNAAVKSLDQLGLRNKISIIGIAKRLEEIYFPGDSVPIYIDKNSYSLKIIQMLRNEAHRFGIEFHRKQRSRTMIKSDLDKIGGIGPKTKELLLKHFRSVKNIAEADQYELQKLIGKAKSTKIIEYLQNLTQNMGKELD